jgi:anti-sigma B factor antagonist
MGDHSSREYENVMRGTARSVQSAIVHPPFEMTSDGTTAVLRVTGDLDIAVEDGTVEAVAGALAAGPPTGQVTLDLSGVAFIDSSGLRALLRIHKEHGPRVRLGAVSPAVARLLELTGTADLFSPDDNGHGA